MELIIKTENNFTNNKVYVGDSDKENTINIGEYDPNKPYEFLKTIKRDFVLVNEIERTILPYRDDVIYLYSSFAYIPKKIPQNPYIVRIYFNFYFEDENYDLYYIEDISYNKVKLKSYYIINEIIDVNFIKKDTIPTEHPNIVNGKMYIPKDYNYSFEKVYRHNNLEIVVNEEDFVIKDFRYFGDKSIIM